ncbi:hypothetical protein ACA910_016044 [Epithemia clementina (nom. ined.)]
MPELPEVEQFRKILSPLISKSLCLKVTLISTEKPHKVWLSENDVSMLHQQQVVCSNVLRKGKQLCMILQPQQRHDSLLLKKDDLSDTTAAGIECTGGRNCLYLLLHMGMTGSIKSPGVVTSWGHKGSLKDDDEDCDEEGSTNVFPPKYAYLIFQTGEYRAAFCDPRKFGKCKLSVDLSSSFDLLAPDALSLCCSIDDDDGRDANNDNSNKNSSEAYQYALGKIVNQSTGIKGMLLDQRRAVSGVGNWVADEVLYQIKMHPDQYYVSHSQAAQLLVTLQKIVEVAVDCLAKGDAYPPSWLFHFRWTKTAAGKDANGNSITFIKSGGRTSAIILPSQQLRKSQKPRLPENHEKETEKEIGKQRHAVPELRKRKRRLRN